MKSFNQITLVGYVGGDPTVNRTKDGKAVANFSLATNDFRDNTTWFRVSAFSRLAEIVQEYVHKGSALYITGSLGTSEYQGKTYLEVTARDVQFLDKKDAYVEPKAKAAKANTKVSTPADELPEPEIEDDDIPF